MYRGFTMGLGVLKSCVISLTVACLVIFWGCAAVVETREEPETAVTKGVEDQENRVKTRVHEYWGYKIKRDFEKSYLYESPEYRKEVKLVDYLKSFGPGVEWLGAEVDRVVRYRWTMVSAGPKEGITSTSTEKWKDVNGTWYHLRKARKTVNTPKNLDSERR
jgi:hypothetical protein